MRKHNPNDVIDSFTGAVRASLDEWATVSAAVAGHAMPIRRGVSKDAFFRLAVRWETFRSDWLIAAAAKDPSRLRSTLADEVDRTLRGRPGLEEVRHYTEVSLPLHPTLGQTRGLLDPSGMNMALTSGVGKNQWVSKSDAYLAPHWADRILGIPLQDLRAVELVERLRNLVAHGSTRSLDAANSTLAALSDPENRVFAGNRLSNAGSVAGYLHKAVDGSARVEHFHHRLAHIAQRMRA